MGKMIDAHIVVVGVATGQQGNEGEKLAPKWGLQAAKWVAGKGSVSIVG